MLPKDGYKLWEGHIAWCAYDTEQGLVYLDMCQRLPQMTALNHIYG